MASTAPQPARDWSSLSQDERDAAYNNRAAIAAADDLVASRRAASDDVRARFRGHLDQPYGEGPRERWDIFPGSDPDAPCLVFIHGGYWQGGQPREFSACLRGALERGWSAAHCGYPLAPQASLADIVGSVSRALDWFDEHRASYGIAGPVILAGWSAGAHLATMNAGHDMVSAVLCMSGIFDLAPIRDTFLNAKLNLSDDDIAKLSPVHLTPVEKPFIIACGAEELPELRRQSQALYQLRDSAGLQSSYTVLTGANHLTILEQLMRADSELLNAAEGALS